MDETTKTDLIYRVIELKARGITSPYQISKILDIKLADARILLEEAQKEELTRSRGRDVDALRAEQVSRLEELLTLIRETIDEIRKQAQVAGAPSARSLLALSSLISNAVKLVEQISKIWGLDVHRVEISDSRKPDSIQVGDRDLKPDEVQELLTQTLSQLKIGAN